MRIAFSGSACVGKSTLFEAFKNRWPMYGFPNKTYRDVIKENNLNHSSKTNEETQLLILDWMMQEQVKYPKDLKVVYDRCTYDNLAYTLQGNENSLISDEVTAATISLVRESMKDIDIIFWIRRSPHIKLISDNLRDVDEKFVHQTDRIFEDLMHQYCENLESDIFFPKEDCPAIIEVEGVTTSDRLSFISEFIDRNGNLIETETSILDPQNIDILESMLKDQENQQVTEEQMKKIMNQFKK